jgi:hypothetical protein
VSRALYIARKCIVKEGSLSIGVLELSNLVFKGSLSIWSQTSATPSPITSSSLGCGPSPITSLSLGYGPSLITSSCVSRSMLITSLINISIQRLNMKQDVIHRKLQLEGIKDYNHRLKDLKSVPMLTVLETASNKDPTEIVI